MYTNINFKTKKAFKEAVDAWNKFINMNDPGVIHANPPDPVHLYAPGLGQPKQNGTEYVEGPHYPALHTWYAQVTMKDGLVAKVK